MSLSLSVAIWGGIRGGRVWHKRTWDSEVEGGYGAKADALVLALKDVVSAVFTCFEGHRLLVTF